MLQLSELKHVALAMVLGTTALTGTAEHVFAQDAPAAVVIPAPAEGRQAITVENGGAVSVILLPAADAGAVVLPGTDALVQSAVPPLDNPTTAYSPMPGNVPWEMDPSSSSDVLTSDSPPLDNPPNTGEFSNTPWKG